MRLVALLACCGMSLFAQTAQTYWFRAQMSSANEVPPASAAASGSATILAHVVRDASGQIASGSVDFIADYTFPGPVTLTGMHIHPGAAGTAGPVAISSGLASTTDSTGVGNVEMQAEVDGSSQPALAALRGLVDGDPTQYYVNLHTSDNPAGALRGQLQGADHIVLMGMMSPLNEVPPVVGSAGTAVGTVRVVAARDAHGVPTSARVVFDVDYTNFPGATFTGLHIHGGAAGKNGGVILSSGLGAGANSVAADPSGTGNIHRVIFDVDMNNAAQVAAVQGLFDNPGAYYINIHTTDHPAGIARSQLMTTDDMPFQVTMQPANEVPAVSVNGNAIAGVHVHTLRYEDGTVEAGAVEFDVNTRLPGAATFTGLHIHQGAAGVAGPVSISSGLTSGAPVNSATGFANIYRSVTVVPGPGVATLDAMTAFPENEYVNIHTSDHPAGVARAQLAPPNTAPPTVSAVVSANLDKNATTLAPGGLISIFGSNLAKVTTDLSGWHGGNLPTMLNGVAVAVGSQFARLLYVSPTQVNAEVPFETATGAQSLSLNNDNAPSAGLPVTIAPVAPAVFFFLDSGAAIAQKAADFSLVTSSNPAHAGDTVVLYLTGMGQTSPALITGRVVPSSPFANTAPVTVTIGGNPANVVYSVASPGFVGLYQVAVTMPAGVSAGNAQVVVQSGGVTAGTVTLPVQ